MNPISHVSTPVLPLNEPLLPPSETAPPVSGRDDEAVLATGGQHSPPFLLAGRPHEHRIRLQHTHSHVQVDDPGTPSSSAAASNQDEAIDVRKSYDWPVLTCVFTVDAVTGELAWADAKVQRQSGSEHDAHALSSLCAELNRIPAFSARMQAIAANMTPGQPLELCYKMGASMDRQYHHLRSRCDVSQATLWKDADRASRHRTAIHGGGSPATTEEDYLSINLQSVSVMSAAVSGMQKQGAHWDLNTGSDDYARMTQVMPEITVRALPLQGATDNPAALAQAAAAADEIGQALCQELGQARHGDLRAAQALSHARYQAGRIEHSWGALAGSMIGGAVYSLGMMVLNNYINRSMIPADVRHERGLDHQSGIKAAFTDVSEDLLPVATPWQKLLMTLNPSWQLGSWEIFDNAILNSVLGGDDDGEPAPPEQAPQAERSSAAEQTPAAGQEQATAHASALVSVQRRIAEGLSELTASNLKAGLTSVATKASSMMGEMVSSAPFAVPAGIVSGVFSWPDKAIEIWKPGRLGAPFKAGFKIAVTSPVSSLACSSGFFLKMGEVAAETEAAVLQALEERQLAWPERNPFDAAQPFDRSDLEQIKRAVWDMTQDQLNNEPDALAIRLSVPMEFLSGMVQGGISLIPGMNQAISFALDTVFFGPGELLWMTITGAVSNHANERELRARLADVMQRCEQQEATPAQARLHALQYLLDNKLISEAGLRQWQEQTVSMLGGAMIHQVYERSGDLKNVGRAGMRGLVDLTGEIGAVMPEVVRTMGADGGRKLAGIGRYVGARVGEAVDGIVAAGMYVAKAPMSYIMGAQYQADEQAAKRYADALKNLPASGAKAIADMLTPAENNMRVRARLPYERALLLRQSPVAGRGDPEIGEVDPRLAA